MHLKELFNSTWKNPFGTSILNVKTKLMTETEYFKTEETLKLRYHAEKQLNFELGEVKEGSFKVGISKLNGQK